MRGEAAELLDALEVAAELASERRGPLADGPCRTLAVAVVAAAAAAAAAAGEDVVGDLVVRGSLLEHQTIPARGENSAILAGNP